MKKHILLENSFVYPKKDLQDFTSDCLYDLEKGYWIHNNSQQPLMTSENKPILMTKKADVETGEDKKGE